MSTYMGGVDANHMISVGDEGFLDWGRGEDWPYNAADGVDHEALSALPNIDYATYHVYPDSWGGKDVPWVTQWIVDHQTAAAELGKPTILEEFGLRDQSRRDAAYQTWADTVRTGGGDGWMFWILTGIQDDGQLYPDYDGFRVNHPSATATVLSNAAVAIGGGSGDVTPPSTPGTPAASGVTASGAALSWTASTDSGGLAGYVVYREQGATDPVLAQPTTNAATLTGLTPGTQYQVYVRARDNAGNLSGPSSPVTFTTLPGATGTCKVAYTATNWGGGGGFTANVTITNTGTAAINGWTLAFAFTSGQRVADGWSATWNQPTGSATVTAANMPWNAAIAPGSSVGIGFNGSYSSTNPAPAAFTLSGAPCTIG